MLPGKHNRTVSSWCTTNEAKYLLKPWIRTIYARKIFRRRLIWVPHRLLESPGQSVKVSRRRKGGCVEPSARTTLPRAQLGTLEAGPSSGLAGEHPTGLPM